MSPRRRSKVKTGILLLMSLSIATGYIPTKCLYEPTKTVSFIGCFSDNPNDSPTGQIRLFSYIYTENGNYDFKFMSNDVCILICLERGYLYAGTQVGLQCFCGDDPYMYAFHTKVDDWLCSRSCQGDTSQTCGNDYKLTVYSTGFNADNNINVRASHYSRYASSTQLSGSYIDLYSGLTLVKCAAQCRTNNNCRVFSFKLDECKLYAIYSSGICYAVADGLQSSLGENVYISR